MRKCVARFRKSSRALFAPLSTHERTCQSLQAVLRLRIKDTTIGAALPDSATTPAVSRSIAPGDDRNWEFPNRSAGHREAVSMQKYSETDSEEVLVHTNASHNCYWLYFRF